MTNDIIDQEPEQTDEVIEKITVSRPPLDPQRNQQILTQVLQKSETSEAEEYKRAAESYKKSSDTYKWIAIGLGIFVLYQFYSD